MVCTHPNFHPRLSWTLRVASGPPAPDVARRCYCATRSKRGTAAASLLACDGDVQRSGQQLIDFIINRTMPHHDISAGSPLQPDAHVLQQAAASVDCTVKRRALAQVDPTVLAALCVGVHDMSESQIRVFNKTVENYAKPGGFYKRRLRVRRVHRYTDIFRTDDFRYGVTASAESASVTSVASARARSSMCSAWATAPAESACRRRPDGTGYASDGVGAARLANPPMEGKRILTGVVRGMLTDGDAFDRIADSSCSTFRRAGRGRRFRPRRRLRRGAHQQRPRTPSVLDQLHGARALDGAARARHPSTRAQRRRLHGVPDNWGEKALKGMLKQLDAATSVEELLTARGVDLSRNRKATAIHHDARGPDVIQVFPTNDALDAGGYDSLYASTVIPCAAVVIRPRPVRDEVALNLDARSGSSACTAAAPTAARRSPPSRDPRRVRVRL